MQLWAQSPLQSDAACCSSHNTEEKKNQINSKNAYRRVPKHLCSLKEKYQKTGDGKDFSMSGVADVPPPSRGPKITLWLCQTSRATFGSGLENVAAALRPLFRRFPCFTFYTDGRISSADTQDKQILCLGWFKLTLRWVKLCVKNTLPLAIGFPTSWDRDDERKCY